MYINLQLYWHRIQQTDFCGLHSDIVDKLRNRNCGVWKFKILVHECCRFNLFMWFQPPDDINCWFQYSILTTEISIKDTHRNIQYIDTSWSYHSMINMHLDSTIDGRNPAPGMYKPVFEWDFCQVERIHRDLVRQRDTFGWTQGILDRWIQVGTLEKNENKIGFQQVNRNYWDFTDEVFFSGVEKKCDPWKNDENQQKFGMF